MLARRPFRFNGGTPVTIPFWLKAVGQGSGGNLSYLRHVVAAYMEMDDGQVEQDALFQVIATFLQFDAPTVQRLHLARRRKAEAAGGLFGKWM